MIGQCARYSIQSYQTIYGCYEGVSQSIEHCLQHHPMRTSNADVTNSPPSEMQADSCTNMLSVVRVEKIVDHKVTASVLGPYTY